MSGINTNGLPAINTANAASWPLPATTQIPTDTGNPNGVYPESQNVTPAQLAANRGPVIPITIASLLAAGDASQGSDFSFTLAATGNTVTISNPAPGQRINLYITQDATGSRTITTWTNFWFPGGTEPTLTATAAALDIVSATWNATLGKWLACNTYLDNKA